MAHVNLREPEATLSIVRVMSNQLELTWKYVVYMTIQIKGSVMGNYFCMGNAPFSLVRDFYN